MAAYYHMMIEPKEGKSRTDVENLLDKAQDWFRYRNNCWIVYTNRSAARWYELLEDLITPDGTALIVKLNATDRQGWMTKEFWDWINTSR